MADRLMLTEPRQALVDLVAPELPGLGAERILYEGETVAGIPATQTVARISFKLPRRRTISSSDGQRKVQQTGNFQVDWLVPTGAFIDLLAKTEGVVALLREQTVAGGVQVQGDPRTSRLPDEHGRTVMRTEVRWRTTWSETIHGDTEPGPLTKAADAILAVRRVWESRIELASPGWGGLSTRWDHVPDVPVAPALPWCGYWIGSIDANARETSGTTETVLGRALIQLHTSPRGIVPTLTILERIIQEHSRITNTVSIGPVDLEAHSVGPAATLQTNLRIPFSFERVR